MHKNVAIPNMLIKTASHKTIQEEDWCLHRFLKSQFLILDSVSTPLQPVCLNAW
jgi:hypothetical protein